MKKQQSGFTLIELVMVIVILGILAVTVVPKYIDLKGDAQTAALEGVVGAIASANSTNYAARSVGTGKGNATIGLTCSTAAAAILDGGIPTGYSLSATAIVAGANSCTVTQTGGATATVNITGI